MADGQEEAASSDPGRQERALLISCLHQVTECLKSTVSESRNTFAAALNVQDYITLDNPKGIKRLFGPMSAYAKALSTLGYRRWKDVEECVSRHYRDETVQETTEDLLSIEEGYKDFVSTVEKDLDSYEAKQAFEKTIAVGDFLPAELNLSLTDGSTTTLESYWKRSKFTLLILIRHFG